MNILQVDHIGVRVVDAKRAVDFYRRLGFEVILEVDFDVVTIMKNAHGVELNLITNGVGPVDDKNILMDVPEKHPRTLAGYRLRPTGRTPLPDSCPG